MKRILFALLLALVASVTTLNFVGYCFAENRIRSRAEYINIAVAAIMSNVEAETPGEFLRRYPNCCRVYYWDGPAGWNFVNAPLFNFGVVVEVAYQLPAPDSIGRSALVQFVAVSKCGNAHMTDSIGS